MRLATILGNKAGPILRNHGLLTVGRSVGEAWVLMCYPERACLVLMDLLRSGAPYRVPEPAIRQEAARQYRDFWPGESEWPALLRLADKVAPDYRD